MSTDENPASGLETEISYLRIAADGLRIVPEAMDADGVAARLGRAADALEAALKHHPIVASVRYCETCARPYPCAEVRDILAALTGKGEGDDGR